MGSSDELKVAIDTEPDAPLHWKPIMDASFAGRADMVGLLLDAGADPNIVSGNATRHTPLTRICQYHKTIPKHEGHAETLSLLLTRGADPSSLAGPQNLKPLCYAAMGPLKELVDVLERTQLPLNPFDAALLCDIEALKHCADEIDDQLKDGSDRTPLHYLAMSGIWKEQGVEAALECAEYLIERGVDVRGVQPIPDGGTVFHADALWWCVAYQSNFELASLLLAKGASADHSIYAASFDGDEQLCSLLDEHGADWNLPFEGRTPLMDVLAWNRTKIVPWLIEHGADVKTTDDDGLNSLHYAAKRGVNDKTLALLIDAGADPSTRDGDGRTALDHARAKKRKKAIAFLEGYQRT